MTSRLKRTTNKQYEVLLDFVENNKILVHGKTRPAEADTVKKLWETFAQNINSLGIGPCKTGDQWKRVSFRVKITPDYKQ